LAKIALIGGGSAVFARTLLHDLFQTEALAGTTYCLMGRTPIIEAVETGVPFTFNGNVMNKGYIDNLPADSCVETPVVADGDGFHPQPIGSLPSPLAALNATNVRVQQLAAEAAVTGDPETLFAAVALDPLTAAVLSLRETRDMTAELLEAQREFCPQYIDGALMRRADIDVPAGTVGVETPIDPALATAHRLKAMFG
jgi:alpha-galactosidase